MMGVEAGACLAVLPGASQLPISIMSKLVRFIFMVAVYLGSSDIFQALHRSLMKAAGRVKKKV